jgi:hypothetical protein
LDFSLAPEALQLSLVPDVLILPSDIKYFVKVNYFQFKLDFILKKRRDFHCIDACDQG